MPILERISLRTSAEYSNITIYTDRYIWTYCLLE
jgi:hypothetical protein